MSRANTLAPAAAEILDFWFLPPGDPQHGQARREWFIKNPAFDEQIRTRFGALLERALSGELMAWTTSPHGTLALIVLLDQFTRNAFRGTARAFAGDDQALALARTLVEQGGDRQLVAVERQFAYLPFEHAEDETCQALSVELFGRLLAETGHAPGVLEYAERHREVIRRFGRFPHRNELLGRQSTNEERSFLTEPGSRF